MTKTTSASRDRNLVSDEPWEVETIHRHFPNHTHQQVKTALEAVKKELGGSESRDKIMEKMRARLK